MMLMIMWIRNRLINAMTGLKGGREREGTCGCKWIESLLRLWSNAMMMIELKAIRCLILWSDTCYGQGSSGQADSKSNQKKTRLIAFAPLFFLCRYHYLLYVSCSPKFMFMRCNSYYARSSGWDQEEVEMIMGRKMKSKDPAPRKETSSICG